jgi:hypothetical protein
MHSLSVSDSHLHPRRGPDMPQRIIRTRCLGRTGDSMLDTTSYDLPDAIERAYAVARSDVMAKDLAFDLDIARWETASGYARFCSTSCQTRPRLPSPGASTFSSTRQ